MILGGLKRTSMTVTGRHFRPPTGTRNSWKRVPALHWQNKLVQAESKLEDEVDIES